MPPLFDFAPDGVCRAADVAACAVRFYRTLSPLPGRSRGGMLSVALSLGLPQPEVIRHRSSLEPGLSSRTPQAKHRRSPDPLARHPIAGPPSCSKSRLQRIARHWPSITPSTFSGRKRRWNATTALGPSAMP